MAHKPTHSKSNSEVFIARVVPLSYFYFYFFPAQDMQQISYLLFAYFGTIAL